MDLCAGMLWNQQVYKYESDGLERDLTKSELRSNPGKFLDIVKAVLRALKIFEMHFLKMKQSRPLSFERFYKRIWHQWKVPPTLVCFSLHCNKCPDGWSSPPHHHHHESEQNRGKRREIPSSAFHLNFNLAPTSPPLWFVYLCVPVWLNQWSLL